MRELTIKIALSNGKALTMLQNGINYSIVTYATKPLRNTRLSKSTREYMTNKNRINANILTARKLFHR